MGTWWCRGGEESSSLSESSSSSSSWVIPEDYPYSRRICVRADAGHHYCEWPNGEVMTITLTVVFTNAYVDSRPLEVKFDPGLLIDADDTIEAESTGELIEMSSTINSVYAVWSASGVLFNMNDHSFPSSPLCLYATIHTQTETGALTATYSGNRTSTAGRDEYINSEDGVGADAYWDFIGIRSYNADGTTMRTDWVLANRYADTYSWPDDTLPDYLL